MGENLTSKLGENLTSKLGPKIKKKFQVTINCAERGLLLLRVRDEINMTLQAYQTIYESSIGFGCRKALYAKKGEIETSDLIQNLQSELIQLENEANDLKAKIDAIQRKEEREREALKRKQAEEVQFLKVRNFTRTGEDHDFLGEILVFFFVSEKLGRKEKNRTGDVFSRTSLYSTHSRTVTFCVFFFDFFQIFQEIRPKPENIPGHFL